MFIVFVNDVLKDAQEAFEGAVKFLFPQLEQFATTTCSLSGACEDSQKVNFDVGSFRSSVQGMNQLNPNCCTWLIGQSAVSTSVH